MFVAMPTRTNKRNKIFFDAMMITITLEWLLRKSFLLLYTTLTIFLFFVFFLSTCAYSCLFLNWFCYRFEKQSRYSMFFFFFFNFCIIYIYHKNFVSQTTYVTISFAMSYPIIKYTYVNVRCFNNSINRSVDIDKNC